MFGEEDSRIETFSPSGDCPGKSAHFHRFAPRRYLATDRIGGFGRAEGQLLAKLFSRVWRQHSGARSRSHSGYITIGRNGSVSDIAFMERTSSLSKTQLSLIFGGVSAIHAWRIFRDPRYTHFFLTPTSDGAAVGFAY